MVIQYSDEKYLHNRERENVQYSAVVYKSNQFYHQYDQKYGFFLMKKIRFSVFFRIPNFFPISLFFSKYQIFRKLSEIGSSKGILMKKYGIRFYGNLKVKNSKSD